MPTQNHFADSPREVGLDPEKVEALLNRAEREVKDGLLPSSRVTPTLVAAARHRRRAGSRQYNEFAVPSPGAA